MIVDVPKLLILLVRKGGLEPPRVLPHQILNLARLPIPPLSHLIPILIQRGLFSEPKLFYTDLL